MRLGVLAIMTSDDVAVPVTVKSLQTIIEIKITDDSLELLRVCIGW